MEIKTSDEIANSLFDLVTDKEWVSLESLKTTLLMLRLKDNKHIRYEDIMNELNKVSSKEEK